MMKKPLIAAIATMAVAAGAQAESKFYGKMNVAAGYESEAEVFGIESYASRLGVKGSEDLGSSKVVYQAEYETDIDGDGTVFKQRNAFVGLAYSGVGTVKMGVIDTPLKLSQGKFDQFNDVVDMKTVISAEDRAANQLNFTTEKLGGLQISASAILAEDGSSDAYSASAVYKTDSLFASVAYNTKVSEESVIRATGVFKMGDLQLGVLVNQVDSDDVGAGEDELAFGVSAAMKAGQSTFKAQYESGDQEDAGATAIKVGMDRKLAKTTKAYVYANTFESDAVEATAVQVGLEHKF